MRRPDVRRFAVRAGFAVRLGFAAVGLASSVSLASCGGEAATAPPPKPSVSERIPTNAVSFAYTALGGGELSSSTTRGRITVLAFISIDNLLCQAQVRYLQAMAKHDGDKVAYGIVMMEPADRIVLADLYRQDLQITFPAVLADPDTLAGNGPFAPMDGYPTVFVLDREGRIVSKTFGLSKADELRRVMRGL